MLLDNLYSGETPEVRKAKADELKNNARNLVELHWEGIKALAQALMNEPTSKRMREREPDCSWSRSSAEEEKRIDGNRIRDILVPHDIDARLPIEAD
jgi:hypothetical protein